MTIKADAEEVVQTPSADQNGADNADFDAAFESESTGKEDKSHLQPDGALPYSEPRKKKAVEAPVEEPAEKIEEKVEEKSAEKAVKAEKAAKEGEEPEEDATPKTAAERAEEAAKALDAPASEEGAGKPAEDADDARDILDALPQEYAWAREARESGKLGEFLRTQPKAIQKLATSSSDPEDATYILDLYKKSTETKPEQEPTAKEVKSILEEYGDLKVKTSGGDEKTLNEIAEEYSGSELIEAIGVLQRSMSERAVKPAEAQKPEAGTDLQRRYDELAERVAAQEWWEPILEAHTDGKRLVKSGKVGEWLEKSGTDSLKRLYKSASPEHAIIVLDAYKEAMATDGGKDEKAGKTKKAADDLHGNTITGRRQVKTFAPKGGDDSGSPEDFDAGFDEGSK